MASNKLKIGICVLQIPVINSAVEVTVQIDPEKLREDSTIYKNLTPGCFLYDYRKSLNDAAYEFALENPLLINKKGVVGTRSQGH